MNLIELIKIKLQNETIDSEQISGFYYYLRMRLDVNGAE